MAARGTKGLLRALAVGLFVVTIVALWPHTRPDGSVRGRVSQVYDGDTVEVEGVGDVRILGIDALDGYEQARTKDQARRYGMSREQVRHWAERGTAFARRRLAGRVVAVRTGPEPTDAYGRTLAYVHVGEGEDFGLELLRRGLAAAYRRFEHPRLGGYLAAEGRAQQRRAGMWSDAKIRP